jgi:hypothetical protein
VERLLAWYRIGSSVGAVIALLVANAIPLVGVLFFGWNVWTILIVYWLENGIVGVFNVLRMLKAEGPGDADTGRMTMNGRPIDAGAKASLIPFFVLHYGIFWTVHGIFVLILPVFGATAPDGGPGADMTSGFDPATIALAVIALTISHGVSYYVNFLRGGEYRRVSAAGQMFAPYGRLVVLHRHTGRAQDGHGPWVPPDRAPQDRGGSALGNGLRSLTGRRYDPVLDGSSRTV